MAAGLGFKTFTTGEVLTAADVNGYLMQGVLVFASSAARSAAITSPQEGQVSYLKDTNSTEYYTGSAWTALGAAAPSFSLLNAGGTALSGTTTTISGISGMSTLWINITELSSDTASATPRIIFNADSGNNYNHSGSWNNAPATYATSVVGTNTTGTGGQTFIYFGSMSNNAGSTVSGGLMVHGCNSAGTKVGMLVSGATASTGSGHKSWNQVFNYVGTSTISSVSIIAGTGNFDGGTVYVYGSA